NALVVGGVAIEDNPDAAPFPADAVQLVKQVARALALYPVPDAGQAQAGKPLLIGLQRLFLTLGDEQCGRWISQSGARCAGWWGLARVPEAIRRLVLELLAVRAVNPRVVRLQPRVTRPRAGRVEVGDHEAIAEVVPRLAGPVQKPADLLAVGFGVDACPRNRAFREPGRCQVEKVLRQ